MKDTSGRAFTSLPTIELVIPATGEVAYQRLSPPTYDTATTAASDLGGAFPGGQSLLFQGLWTDPVTGLAYARARWLDSRNASWLQEDPQDDADSPSLYAFVALRPNEFTDPRGLSLGLGDYGRALTEALVGTVADTGSAAWSVVTNERVQGTLQALGGVAEVTMGAAGLLAPEPTMLTKVAGAVAVVHGIDDIAAGLKAAATGKQQETLTKRGVKFVAKQAGLDEDTAELVANVADMGIGVAAPAAAARSALLAETKAGRRILQAEAAEVRAGQGVVAKARRAERAVETETREAKLVEEMAIGCPLFRSFTPGTVVATEAGEKAIEEVAPGDEVWAYDETTGERNLRKVLATFLHTGEESLVLDVAGERLTTTAEHPFYVVGRQGREWVEAGKLTTDDRLLSLSGETLKVDGIERTSGTFALFNFEVEGDHDYFVGENGLLVHNACPTGVGGTGANYKKLTGQGLYVLKDPASKEVLYVGRGDVPARFLAHAKDAAKGPLDQVILWTNNLSKAQAKGLEQALIERFGGAYSKTYANVTPSRLMNQISSFRKLNPNYYFYRRAVTPELFKETLRRIGR